MPIGALISILVALEKAPIVIRTYRKLRMLLPLPSFHRVIAMNFSQICNGARPLIGVSF